MIRLYWSRGFECVYAVINGIIYVLREAERCVFDRDGSEDIFIWRPTQFKSIYDSILDAEFIGCI